MKRLFLILTILACRLALAGEFKKVGDHVYEFTGEMAQADALEYKRLFLKDDSFTLTVDSPGGYLDAGVDMALTTLMFNQSVKIVAKECYSAAALWAAADPDMEFYDDKSFLTWHLPWLSMAGFPTEQTTGETSLMAVSIWLPMSMTLGERALPLFAKMCQARDWGGINAFVVQSKGSPERVGLWTESGWTWQDGSTGQRARLTPVPEYRKPPR